MDRESQTGRIIGFKGEGGDVVSGHFEVKLFVRVSVRLQQAKWPWFDFHSVCVRFSVLCSVSMNRNLE